jgi:ribosomal protein S18 acetylase RimI-like enzyme
MTGVTIRRAVPADSPAIVRIAERGRTAAYGAFLPQETIDTALIGPDTVRERIEHEEDVVYFVAEKHGTIRGFAMGDVSGEETVATLGAIYVNPDQWGEGIGTTLLKEFEVFCRQRGYNAVQLRVFAENDVGVSFYRKHGYDMIDQRDWELFDESVRVYEFRGQIA